MIDADQKIPDSVSNITFIGKVETAVRLGIKSRFGIMSFDISLAIWDCGFLFNSSYCGIGSNY